MVTKIDEVLNDLKQQLLDDDALYVKVVTEDEPADLMSGDEMYTVSIAALKDYPAESIGTFRAGEDKFLVYPLIMSEPEPKTLPLAGITSANPDAIQAGTVVARAKNDKIEYRFNEGAILDEVRAYVDSTYTKHYATNGGIQATDAIIATGNGLGFCVGNILKYAWRLGKKDGFNNIDVMKVIHYSIILLYIINKEKEAK